MAMTGGCQCGAVRYEAEGEPIGHALCHCEGCRASAGAPAVAWMMFAEDAVKITKGELKIYNSSGAAHRHFCADCGTGVLYTNAENLPGLVDIQSATLDDAADHPPGAQIQVAERLSYMAELHTLHAFDRYPEE